MADNAGIRIEKRTFLSTVCVLLCVMICAGVLTLVLPQGRYERQCADNGYEEIIADSYTVVDGERLPVWRWFTAPVEVLFSSDSLVAVMVTLFLIFIGGTFLVLDRSGVMKWLLGRVVRRFGGRRYLLMAALVLVGMLAGSVMGLFEEFAPLVPIVVALSLALGWDSLMGLGMSILAVGFGFSVGTFNPFSILVAQELAGLPIFSGLWFRILSFCLFYALLFGFLYAYGKKLDRDPTRSPAYESDRGLREKYRFDPDEAVGEDDPRLKKAVWIFVAALGCAALYILVSLVMTYCGNDILTDFTLPMLLVALTVGGLLAGRASGCAPKALLRDFGKGMLAMLPGALLIVMAMSAKQIVQAGGVMDTILHGAYQLLSGLGKYESILLVFAFVLVLEFFISSASAKAFLVIPLVVPFASLIGLTRQSIVQAYCFSDGFTNVFWPTNACLLIVLGLVNLSYGRWLRFSWKLMLGVLALSVGLLLGAVAIGYGPA